MDGISLQGRASRAWWTCLVAYVLVAGFVVIQTLVKEPAGTQAAGITILWISIKLAPWILCSVSFITKRPNGFILLCFASLLYFTFAGVEASGQHGAAFWARLEILALATVFISAMMYARWKKQLDGMPQPNEK